MTWYEKAVQAASRIEPDHTSPWKLASTFALLSIAESLVAQGPSAPVGESSVEILTTAEAGEEGGQNRSSLAGG